MRRSEKAQHLIRTRIKDGRTGKSKVNIEENKIKNVIDNIPTGSFTVLDFMKTLSLTYPEDWETLVKRFGTFGRKRRYMGVHIFQTDSTSIPRNPTQSSFPLLDTSKANSPIIEERLKRKGKSSEANGSLYTRRNLRIQRIELRNRYHSWNSTYAKYAQQTRQKISGGINFDGLRTVDVDIATTRHNCLNKLITQHSQHDGQE